MGVILTSQESVGIAHSWDAGGTPVIAGVVLSSQCLCGEILLVPEAGDLLLLGNPVSALFLQEMVPQEMCKSWKGITCFDGTDTRLGTP